MLYFDCTNSNLQGRCPIVQLDRGKRRKKRQNKEKDIKKDKEKKQQQTKIIQSP